MSRRTASRREGRPRQQGEPGREKARHSRVGSTATGRNTLKMRPASRWLSIILLTVASSPVHTQTGPAADADITPDQVQTGSLLLRMISGYDVATRMNTDIEARISGIVARVRVRQSFRNDGRQWVEGIYVFPLPDAAAVDRVRMHIGERIVEGEIREKSEARKEYEAARTAGKKTTLVEQQRANLFTTSVANIVPGEKVVVEIEYLEKLKIDDGLFSLRFPLTATPRYIPGTPLTGRKGSGWAPDTTNVPDASLITPPVVTRSQNHKVRFEASIDAGVPLASIESRYHPIDVRDASGHYEIELSDPHVPMDHDIELTWRPVPDKTPRAAVFAETWQGERHLLIMLLPPDDVAAPRAPMPRELIFVIDTSGSMHGTSLTQASRALTLALDRLDRADKFNVIQFNSVTSALFRKSVTATPNNVRIAKGYVAALTSNGGTEMRPALARALKIPVAETHLRQVIFITDGSVGNEKELFGLIEQKLGNTRLFTVGIGSAPNSWFMRKAAEAGRGTLTLISALHEVNDKMNRLFRKLERPQLTDITVEWPSGIVTKAYPQTIPDLYAGEPIVVKALLENEPKQGDVLKVSGNSMLGTWGTELSIDTREVSPGVAALWARARIEDLMDRERRGAARREIRKAVIDTALSHHLVSQYTSLVAVDKTPLRAQQEILDREQVPNLLPYGQNMNAIFGFPATATSARSYRMNGAILLVAALLLSLVFVFGRHGSASRAGN